MCAAYLTVPETASVFESAENSFAALVERAERFEQWGSGIGRMTDACIEAGLVTPTLEEIGCALPKPVRLSNQALPERALEHLARGVNDAAGV